MEHLHLHQIAAARLAVDGKIEEGQITMIFGLRQPHSDYPDVFRLERPFLTDDSAFVPGWAQRADGGSDDQPGERQVRAKATMRLLSVNVCFANTEAKTGQSPSGPLSDVLASGGDVWAWLSARRLGDPSLRARSKRYDPRRCPIP